MRTYRYRIILTRANRKFSVHIAQSNNVTEGSFLVVEMPAPRTKTVALRNFALTYVNLSCKGFNTVHDRPAIAHASPSFINAITIKA